MDDRDRFNTADIITFKSPKNEEVIGVVNVSIAFFFFNLIISGSWYTSLCEL